MAGLTRSKGVVPRQVEAPTVPLGKRVVATCRDGLGDVRDRALILIGLAGGFRPSKSFLIEGCCQPSAGWRGVEPREGHRSLRRAERLGS
jgi:hypothetical protein